MKKMLIAGTLAMSTLLAACSGGAGSTGSKDVASAPSDAGSVSGDITVLTNRTDLAQDGTLKGYAEQFTKLYPKVNVKFQGVTDYEGEVKIRMNTENYGDVLLIPAALSKKDYPNFFAPLGDPATLGQKYRFVPNGTVDGKVYGIANNGNANGFVYNKAVWTQAGITDWPTTPEQFLTDLQTIKQKTQATPYYTNYHDGWPLTSWWSALGSPSCKASAVSDLAADSAPWKPGKDLYAADSLLYSIVHDKLSEADPTTTNWENSKTLIGTGKVATMWLGSWAVSQMQDAAKKAGKSADDIGFMPFPQQVNGKFCSVVGADYLQAINIHSKHKEAARAWIDWFTDKSPYATSQGDVPTLKSAPLPASLAPFQQQGVQLLELDQSKSAVVSNIDNAAEVGLQKPDYRQQLVDAARGAGGSEDKIFSQLNSKWADAQKSAGS